MAAAAFALNTPLAPVDAALNSINANHGLPPLPGGARKVFSSPSELDTDYGVPEADLQYLIDEGCSLPNVFSVCLEPLDYKRMGNAWRRATLTGTTSVLLLPHAQVLTHFNGAAGAQGSTYEVGGWFWGSYELRLPAAFAQLLTARMHIKCMWAILSAQMEAKNKRAITLALGATRVLSAQGDANLEQVYDRESENQTHTKSPRHTHCLPRRMANIGYQLGTLNMTLADSVNLRNTFKMNIQGHNERERGQSFYRAMMGQSDAVKVAMLKHRPHQRPVNHRTTSVPSTRHASARRVPPRSCAHESRRLQRRDARPHPAPPCVLPPLRLGASRCARTFI